MPTKINPDYQPSPRVAELLSSRFGVTAESARELMGHELMVFKMHFENRDDAKARKSNWDTAFYNWCARKYEDNKEFTALHRPHVPQQGNIFEQALSGVTEETKFTQPSRPLGKPRVQHSPIPGEGETMSTEDALAALSQIRGGKA